MEWSEPGGGSGAGRSEAKRSEGLGGLGGLGGVGKTKRINWENFIIVSRLSNSNSNSNCTVL